MKCAHSGRGAVEARAKLGLHPKRPFGFFLLFFWGFFLFFFCWFFWSGYVPLGMGRARARTVGVTCGNQHELCRSRRQQTPLNHHH